MKRLMLLLIFALSAQVQADNVVVVFDASGSMNDPLSGTNIRRMPAAQQALIQVLSNLPNDTKVGVVAGFTNLDQ